MRVHSMTAAVALIGSIVGGAAAGEPTRLTSGELDRVTAGAPTLTIGPSSLGGGPTVFLDDGNGALIGLGGDAASLVADSFGSGVLAPTASEQLGGAGGPAGRSLTFVGAGGPLSLLFGFGPSGPAFLGFGDTATAFRDDGGKASAEARDVGSGASSSSVSTGVTFTPER